MELSTKKIKEIIDSLPDVSGLSNQHGRRYRVPVLRPMDISNRSYFPDKNIEIDELIFVFNEQEQDWIIKL